METLYIYLLKSSGLVALFFLAYYFMLRKETFFTSNRWFLLAGLFTSVILPLLVFTKIIWVEPIPVNYDWSSLPVRTAIEEDHTEEYIYLGLALTYCIGVLSLLGKFGFDFYSLQKVFKGRTIQRQADFSFINVSENLAPFSFFKTIVYNSALYSPAELESIIEHEKVHSEQHHTIDVLISRIFCILFWFNPIVWFYQKAILQNLEYIADSEASKKISDKKAYQITLLKITTQENCLAITNHFYQSLIKKRIVMLNKNQSSKKNSWKYAIVVPALIAFVLLFQIEVVAQEKETTTTVVNAIVADRLIDKDATDTELENETKLLKEDHGIDFIISNVKRNNKGEITAIKVSFDNESGSTGTTQQKGNKPIEPIHFLSKKYNNGKIEIGFYNTNGDATKYSNKINDDTDIFIDGKKVSKEEMDTTNPDDIKTMNVSKNNDKSTIRIVTKTSTNENISVFDSTVPATELRLEKSDPTTINGVQKPKGSYTIKTVTVEKNGIPENTEVYIDGKKVSSLEAESMNQNQISSVNVQKDATSNKNSIRIITKSYVDGKGTMPEPPKPPTPPAFNFKTPKAPNFPKAPRAPKGDPINGDKKAWADFEKKMEDFNTKMKSIEPEMEDFDKKMAEFEKKMIPFNAEMEIFEKKMKAYEKQMEEYQSK